MTVVHPQRPHFFEVMLHRLTDIALYINAYSAVWVYWVLQCKCALILYNFRSLNLFMKNLCHCIGLFPCDIVKFGY